jgi:ribosomal protein S18 acetylase RimI-like enzyme
MILRPYRESDTEAICRITLAVFEPVSIDAAIERNFGLLRGVSWQERKRRDVCANLADNPEGCFVAEENGEILGYVTTSVDHETGVGRILNLAVDAGHQGRGIGKQLVSYALDYFESLGLTYSQIETTTTNEVGMRFYPAVGYREVARKIYYFMELKDRKDRQK